MCTKQGTERGFLPEGDSEEFGDSARFGDRAIIEPPLDLRLATDGVETFIERGWSAFRVRGALEGKMLLLDRDAPMEELRRRVGCNRKHQHNTDSNSIQVG